jgi:3',5'-cyclic-AMP phosphodiesterase
VVKQGPRGQKCNTFIKYYIRSELIKTDMQLVHLSDIHIGGFFKQDVFDNIVYEVNSIIKPDVIIITGDLTDDGLLFQFQRARAEVNKFHCSNVIVLPGNHDFRHTGHLLFNKFFPSPKQIYEFDNVIVLTITTARPDRDEGEVGYLQRSWMEKNVNKYFNNKLKILAMHHHLVSIPDTGSDQKPILDAGDILRTCISSRISLVLCGHKHRPWLWNFGLLEIAYAGTASSNRYRGFFENAYNIINIKEQKISIDIKIVGGKRFPVSRFNENYILSLRT